jgi:hypothetical protein
MTTAAELASYASSFPNFRNRIINGAMQVAQRGTSFTYNSFGEADFCVDRFWFYNAGSATSGTIEQSTDVPSGEGFAYSLFNNTNVQMPSGTNVELTKQGNAAPFVVGNNYTFSFWVKGSSASSGLTVSIGWRNSHANGTNATQAIAAYPTFDVTTSWERVVIPFTLTTSPVSQNNVLDFEYSHPAGAKITGVQLEEGTVATPFEHRPYGTELSLCKRYFQEKILSSRTFGGSQSNHIKWRFDFEHVMRSAPDLIVNATYVASYAPSGNDLTVWGIGASSVILPSLLAISGNKQSFILYLDVPNSGTGNIYELGCSDGPTATNPPSVLATAEL